MENNEHFTALVNNIKEHLFSESRRKWMKRYFLFAIDGADMEVPFSKSTLEEFGQQGDPEKPDYFSSMAQSSTLYDILEDKVVDAQIQHINTSERELAKMHLSRANNLCKLAGNDVEYLVRTPEGTYMQCRVLKVTLSTDETEYLITNVMDKDITREEFCKLYFERWKIEVKYKETKDNHISIV